MTLSAKWSAAQSHCTCHSLLRHSATKASHYLPSSVFAPLWDSVQWHTFSLSVYCVWSWGSRAFQGPQISQCRKLASCVPLKNNPLSPRWSAQAGVELQGLIGGRGRERKTPTHPRSNVQWVFISETHTPGLAVCLTLCCLLPFSFSFLLSPFLLSFLPSSPVLISSSVSPCVCHPVGRSGFPTIRTCLFKSDKPGWQLMRIC